MSYPPPNTPYAVYYEHFDLAHADFRTILAANPDDPRINSATLRWITMDNVKRLWPVANTIAYEKSAGCIAMVTALKDGVISIMPLNKNMPELF